MVGPASPRIALVDAARGVALIGMVVYHLVWDLGFTGLTEQVADRMPWLALARVTAGSFLFLVGVSLVLATAGGIRWRPFLRRLAVVGSAALAVTAGTAWFVPGFTVVFGILHHIVVASVLALPFLPMPVAVTATVSALVLSLPFWASHPAFDAPWLVWLGLWATPPRALDLVPLAPWFGIVLAGVVFARTVIPIWPAAWRHWQPRTQAARALTWAGRHSLPIYLVHQPILIGACMLAVQLGLGQAETSTVTFVSECSRTCQAGGSRAAFCEAACTCLATEAREAGLWRQATRTGLSAEERTRLDGMARSCAARQHGLIP
jgi:uncharacterized membrane protein